MEPATWSAATVQMTDMMMPMTSQGTCSLAVGTPVTARTMTPAAPARPMPMPPSLAPTIMNSRTMSRWNQIMDGLPPLRGTAIAR